MLEVAYDDIRDFIFDEAALLDQRSFDEWYQLFADDGWYWVPNDPTATDPNSTLGLIYDDLTQLRERVWRLNSSYAHAQTPPSHTTHLVSNIQVVERTEDIAIVDSAFVVHEVRRNNGNQYSGRYRHQLTRQAGQLKIQSKKVALVQTWTELGNVSFLL